MNVTDTPKIISETTQVPQMDIHGRPIPQPIQNFEDIGSASSSDELTWATLAHAGVFAGLVVPLGNIIAPLVIYLIKREESAYIAEHAKESLNFQISLMLYLSVSAILVLIYIGFIVMGVLSILWIIFVIQAAIAAHKGESYRYPMTIRFVV